MRIFQVLLLLLCLLPGAAPAQEDDQTYLTRLLSDTLSARGRNVTISGFEGALSSRATAQEITIADDEGVWLTLRDVAIHWNRLALVRGQIAIQELHAAEILMPRRPLPAADALPSPEATEFTLPELPLALNIRALRAERVVIGAPVFGTGVEMALEGAAQLAGGEGRAALTARRIDGTPGHFTLDGSFANATRILSVLLELEEDQGGIAATLLRLPGQPALALSVAGEGVIDDFTADLRLATNGQDRLGGTIVLRGETPEPTEDHPDPAATRHFSADLRGDLTPLLPAEYHDFFGQSFVLAAEGSQHPDGGFDLPRFELSTQAMQLAGSVRLAPGGMVQFIDVTGRIAPPAGTGPVLLPLSGAATEIDGARLALRYDIATGTQWQADLDITGLSRPDIAIARLALSGSGTLTPQPDASGDLLNGGFRFLADGIAPHDPALAAALGPRIGGTATLSWQQGDSGLRLPALSLEGEDFRLQGTDIALAGLGSALRVSGQLLAQADDLSRFAPIADRPLAGRAEAAVSGTAHLLSGAFDIEAKISGQDLALGQPALDGVLQGPSQITLSAERTTAGTQIRALTLSANALSAQASGQVQSGASALSAQLDFSDLGVMGGGFGGTLQAHATLEEHGTLRRLVLTGTSRNLAIGQPELDRLMRGESTLSVEVTEQDSLIRVERFDFANPQLTASASGTQDGDLHHVALSLRLADLALLVPDFPGPLTVQGQLHDTGTTITADLHATGPGQIDARIGGTIARDLSNADLTFTGGAQLALANAFIRPSSIQGPVRFDLRMQGTPGPAALSGSVTASDVRFVNTALGVLISQGRITANLAGGQAMLTAEGRFENGGRLEARGPIGLAAPFPADLAVTLNRARLQNPELYDTRVNGTVTIRGPLAGGGLIAGALALEETELRVPSAGRGGTWPIPDLSHVNEPAEVRATRARAGLLDENGGANGGGNPFGLDLTISAPNRIFLRGRGLDAELGGSLHLGGTTADIVPTGRFDLIRGRLDLLDRRFDISEGYALIQGRFVPYIFLSATTTANGINAAIIIEGDVNEPEISFLSTPPLPEEEVLAQILFGRDLSTLTAFQAAQLASSVATLAGRSGDGIVTRLRRGFNLDNLDVITDGDGNTAIRAGRYITENIYSEIVFSPRGTTELNLNLDLSPSVTLRGAVDDTGTVGIGVFYERDY